MKLGSLFGWWRDRWITEVIELGNEVKAGDVLIIPRQPGDLPPSGWAEAGRHFMRVADGTEPGFVTISRRME